MNASGARLRSMTSAFFVAFSMATSVGCQLVWTPLRVDGGLDAAAADASNLDALELDARGPDASTMRVERVCDNRMDDDGDGYSDCNDPDCFGSDACCDSTSGISLDAEFGSSVPPLWEGSGVTLESAGERTRFGFADSRAFLVRRICVPMALGARISFTLAGGGVTPARFALVLTPRPERGPSGFLDELALRFDQSMRMQVTRSGAAFPLVESCVHGSDAGESLDGGRQDSVQLSGGDGATVVLDLRPSVVGGQTALLAKVSVQNRSGPCSMATVVLDDVPIFLADLVRTEDGTSSCEESPGLFLALEGSGPSTFAFVGSPTPRLEVRSRQCATPAVFSVPRVVVEAPDVVPSGSGGDFAAGGIGAPDLAHDGRNQWQLVFDASAEDRATEIFRRLTTRIGLASGTALSGQTFPSFWTPATSSPTDLGPGNVREPSVRDLSSVGLFTFFARESSESNRYDVVSGLLERSGNASGLRIALAHRPRTDAGPDVDAGVAVANCDSLREPVAVAAPVLDGSGGANDVWLFARCDAAGASRLVLFEGNRDEGFRLLSDNPLDNMAVGDRIVAADALRGPRGALGLWVLARDATGVAEVHFFVDEATNRGRAPNLQPFAGNPILRDGDPILGRCPAGHVCSMTSLAVGTEVDESGRDRLRFLFAVSQRGATNRHFLVAAEQLAPPALDF